MKFEKSMKSVAAASRHTVAQPVYVDLSRANRHGRAANDAAKATERPARRQRTVALADLGLTRIEDALLDAILDNHRNRDSALDRLLDDMGRIDRRHREEMEATAGEHEAPALPVDGYAVPKLQRIEQLLVAAEGKLGDDDTVTFTVLDRPCPGRVRLANSDDNGAALESDHEKD